MLTTPSQQDAKPLARGRRLLVVDIENVIGGAVHTVSDANRARQLVQDAIGLTGDEHVVVGVSHYGMMAADLGWDTPRRLVMRSGADGADLALLEVLTEERIAERFDELILVSGDGIFAEALAALGARGMHTTVVAPATGCSARLRLAASRTVLISTRADMVGDAA